VQFDIASVVVAVKIPQSVKRLLHMQAANHYEKQK
jgi:hypothetical protein